MRKAFTLLELIVVIIVIDIVVTLVIKQYSYIVEQQRTTEAVANISQMRKYARAYYMENGTITTITASDLNIGNKADQLPNSCDQNHYYSYRLARKTDTDMSIDITRCMSGGKIPNYSGSKTYIIVYTWNSTTDKNTIWCYPAGQEFCDQSDLPTSP